MPSKIERIEYTMHRGGTFIFSCDCDERAVLLLDMEARTLHKAVQKLPVFPSFFAQLKPELIRRSIFGTAAIEGNPLTEDQTEKVLDTEVYDLEHVTCAEQEIHNLREVYELLDDVKRSSDNNFLLLETFIQEIHTLLTKNVDYSGNLPGYYRNMQVQVGDKAHGGVYTPPRTLADVKALMQIFVDWINSAPIIATGPFIRAALVHYHFAMIHPFQDGNGRTARFLEAAILTGSDISLVSVMMSNYYYRNIDAYFSAFSQSRKQKSVTPFLEFFFKGVIESLEEIQENSIGVIIPIIFRDYIGHQREIRNITERQHELLLQLTENNGSFTLSELFIKIPFKYLYQDVTESTARRDIKKLVKEAYLITHEGRYYVNFGIIR